MGERAFIIVKKEKEGETIFRLRYSHWGAMDLYEGNEYVTNEVDKKETIIRGWYRLYEELMKWFDIEAIIFVNNFRDLKIIEGYYIQQVWWFKITPFRYGFVALKEDISDEEWTEYFDDDNPKNKNKGVKDFIKLFKEKDCLFKDKIDIEKLLLLKSL